MTTFIFFKALIWEKFCLLEQLSDVKVPWICIEACIHTNIGITCACMTFMKAFCGLRAGRGKKECFWQRNNNNVFLHNVCRKMSSCCGGSKGQYAKQPPAWAGVFTTWYFQTEDQHAYLSVHLCSARKEKELLRHIPCPYVLIFKWKGKEVAAL